MDRRQLLERVTPISKALILGQGWMADLWPRAQEPEFTTELVAHLHAKVFELFKDILAEKADHDIPFLPNGETICYNCQGALHVTGFGPPFFIHANPDTELIIQTSCDTQCTDIEWRFLFPEGWDGGPAFNAKLAVTKSLDWEF